MHQKDIRSGEVRRHEVNDRLAGKIGKEEANYRPSKERESKESCIECVHYLNPSSDVSSCRRVAGVVYGPDLCDLFAARQHEETGNNPSIAITITKD